jgi:hypothetical protein
MASYLPLNFFGTEALGMTSTSTTSLWVDDIVKGILTMVLVVGAGEGKCNFLPFLVVVLVDEGTFSNSGAGGGESYFCGE